MKIRERFQRWRARKGYGVHSPLAYRLIRRAINPSKDYSFYGEELLRDSGAYGKSLRRARRLLRLTAELQPSYVWLSPSSPQIFHEAVRLAGCVVRIYDGKIFPDELARADLVVLGAKPRQTKAQLAKIMLPGKALVAFDCDPAFIAKVKGAMKGGVIIDGVSFLTAVNTSDPALHAYGIFE